MLCKLCLKDKKLQRKSHIIPQFYYKEVKKDGGYYLKIDKYTYREYTKGKTSTKHYTGEYDSNILCRKCDKDIIGQKYDDYASKVLQVVNGESKKFKSIKIESYTNKNDISGKLTKNIDYTKFKLFLLSVLWRASISKRPFFHEVKLGKKHEQILREMIYNGYPKEQEDYPCFICDIGEDEPLLKRTMLPPRKINEDGNISYMFMICGLVYRFTISKYNRKNISLAGVIHPNNDMIIWRGPKNLGKICFSEYRKHILKKSQL